MQRLFTALAIPEQTADRLVALQPETGDGVRCVEARQLHVTLVFIGRADVDDVAARLEPIRVARFNLQIGGPGKFDKRGGGSILWLEVQRHERLVALHQQISAALNSAGETGAAADYTPHLTLARCKKSPSDSLKERFFNQAVPAFDPIEITEFGLYSSTLVNNASVYRLERVFPLTVV